MAARLVDEGEMVAARLVDDGEVVADRLVDGGETVAGRLVDDGWLPLVDTVFVKPEAAWKMAQTQPYHWHESVAALPSY